MFEVVKDTEPRTIVNQEAQCEVVKL